jgi:rhamnose utilization protein RhaD (predicted bifunctional aldolase and dehydrogenase)
MLVKSSGYKMKDISRSKGYSTMDYFNISKLNSSYKYESYLDNDSVFIGKRPSMEFGFHALLKKYVIHTHSIYITALLCGNQSPDLIPSLYKDLKYTYVKYTNPGYDLFKDIKNKQEIFDIYFLENHGIIVTADNDIEVIRLFNKVNEIAKQYLKNTIQDFKEFSLEYSKIKSFKNFLFPDAVIFNNREDKVATLAANNYINYIINQIDTVRPITHKNVSNLLTLNSEKYRINL